MNSIPYLEALGSKLQNEIDNLTSMVQKSISQKDRLIARPKKDGGYKYYSRSRDETGQLHEITLNNNLDLATALAVRDCSSLMLKDAIEQKEAVDNMLKVMTEESHFSRYMSSHPGQASLVNNWIKQQGFNNFLPERELFAMVEEWKKRPYQKNKNHPESLTHNTVVPGLKVRSKSERLMVNEFERKHVAYHYEEAFIGIDDNGNPVVIYPDFTCSNIRLNTIDIVEHLGMCDNENYLNDFFWKLRIYQRAGFYLGQNLIITTETKNSPLDINLVDWIIDNWLI